MKNFKISEFDCHDGTLYPPSWFSDRLYVLIEQLEKIRKAIGDLPLNILSGYRTIKWNKKNNGAKNSMHLQGVAVDIMPSGCSVELLHKTILELIDDKKILDGGVGIYPSWVHYDIRTILGFRPSRWGKKGA